MGRHKPGKPRRERGKNDASGPPTPLDEEHGLNVTLDVTSSEFGTGLRSNLESVLHDLCQEVIRPGGVEIVVTNKYERAVEEYEARSPNRAVDSSAGQAYSATKADGAIAVAKTVELPDSKAVIVVPVQLLAWDRVGLRRVLLHEGQHVRLIQNGDTAWAVHRRTQFDRPHQLLWEFVWLAEILLDEFRCERRLYEIGESALGGKAADYAGVRPRFLEVRRAYERNGNVMQMYFAAMKVLDRIPSILGYAAAEVVCGGSIEEWATVPEMSELLDLIRSFPSSRATVPAQQIVCAVIGIAGLIRKCLQRQGFDGWFREDESRYFSLVNP